MKMKMKPCKPEPIDIDVWEATCKLVKDSEHEDGRLEIAEIYEENGSAESGRIFAGALVKDLFRDEDWKKVLLETRPLYLAFHGCPQPLQLDVWHAKEWHTVWRRGNDFGSLAESEDAADRHAKFTIEEGGKVAEMIDQGKDFAYINGHMNKCHSGNTWGLAFHIGFSTAKNKENAKRVKKEYNKDCGGTGEEEGTINPAVISIDAGKKE